MSWRTFLDHFATGKDAPLDSTFVRDQFDDGFAPNQGDADAASKFHTQLISRVSTQPLPYLDGVEGTALRSIYNLFEQGRQICAAHPGGRGAKAVIWHVLNTHVRPFTAKWHPVEVRGQLRALDMTDSFRAELEALQGVLRRAEKLLGGLARDGAVAPDPRQPGVGDGGREAERAARVRREMAMPLAWGVPLQQGGIENPELVGQINRDERRTILKRRAHYGPTVFGHLGAAGLALSGGGIRSATFSLGVLVALARRGLLPQFDYMSTVSGGGYLGAFLTSLMNSPAEPADAPPRGLCGEQTPFDRSHGESEPIRHLRHFSRYLAAGRLSTRLMMATAQAYGVLMVAVGLASVFGLLAAVEIMVRRLVSESVLLDILIATCASLGIWMLASGPLLRFGCLRQRTVDKCLVWAAAAVVVSGIWVGLGHVHRWVGVPNDTHLWRAGTIAATGIACLVVTSALAGLGARANLWTRALLAALSAPAVPLFVLGSYLLAFDALSRGTDWFWVGTVSALIVAVVSIFLVDVNTTSPHRHYRDRLSEAYLVQYRQATPRETPKLEHCDELALSQAVSDRAPYHLINAALNVPASANPRMQGRSADFFLFSQHYCGSPLVSYRPTEEWERADPHLNLGTAMAISGAAAAPQMGLGTRRRVSFWLALLNVRMAYWLRRPDKEVSWFRKVPGLMYLLREMSGQIDESGSMLYVSDGGHIENLGVYELLRRRCKYIVAVDGEQDERMTFAAVTTLQRLASIDLGVTIEVNLDDLRLNEHGLSRSHFRFCRVRYPGGGTGYLIYLKLSLTGNEGEFLRRYRLDEPDFPHHSTAEQLFSETQFEAYRTLGEHVGSKLFLPSLVGRDLASLPSVDLEKWFEELGARLLD